MINNPLVVRVLVCCSVLVIVFTSPVRAGSMSNISALDQMMSALAPASARAAAQIKDVYRDHLDLLFLPEYGDLQGALMTGGLALLPERPVRFNLAPRLDGLHPIGEKDLTNQTTYLAARPATIGALLEVARRVRSGPVEITSLVRHGGYQEALSVTNANATTPVPMHAMGLAFDIGLINTPLSTVYEIRNVLRRMQQAGDIFFIGERRQLVFHVVPHPSRLGYFADMYTRALGAPPASQTAVVVAPAPPQRRKRSLHPAVVSEIVWASPLAIPAPAPPRPAAPAARTPALPIASFLFASAVAGAMISGCFRITTKIRHSALLS